MHAHSLDPVLDSRSRMSSACADIHATSPGGDEMFRRVMRLLPLLALTGWAPSPSDGVPAAEKMAPPPLTSVTCKTNLSVCQESSCEGWVLLRFDVSGLGAVSNPVVTNACPPGFFDEAALTGVKEWTYPREQAGRRGVTVRLDFRKPR